MLVWATSATLGLCVLVVATASGDDSALGAPPYWAWLLTGLQVTAMWAAGYRTALGVAGGRINPASLDRICANDQPVRLHPGLSRIGIGPAIQLSAHR